MPQFSIDSSREPQILFWQIPYPRLDAGSFQISIKLHFNFAFLVKVQMLIGTGASIYHLFIMVSNWSYETLDFQWNCYFTVKNHVFLVEFKLFREFLYHQYHFWGGAAHALIDGVQVSTFIQRLSWFAKLGELQCFQLDELFSHRFLTFTWLDGTSSNCINDILYELTPVHIAVTVDINLLEQLVAPIHQLIFFIVILSVDLGQDEAGEVLDVETIWHCFPVLL